MSRNQSVAYVTSSLPTGQLQLYFNFAQSSYDANFRIRSEYPANTNITGQVRGNIPSFTGTIGSGNFELAYIDIPDWSDLFCEEHWWMWSMRKSNTDPWTVVGTMGDGDVASGYAIEVNSTFNANWNNGQDRITGRINQSENNPNMGQQNIKCAVMGGDMLSLGTFNWATTGFEYNTSLFPSEGLIETGALERIPLPVGPFVDDGGGSAFIGASEIGGGQYYGAPVYLDWIMYGTGRASPGILNKVAKASVDPYVLRGDQLGEFLGQTTGLQTDIGYGTGIRYERVLSGYTSRSTTFHSASGVPLYGDSASLVSGKDNIFVKVTGTLPVFNTGLYTTATKFSVSALVVSDFGGPETDVIGTYTLNGSDYGGKSTWGNPMRDVWWNSAASPSARWQISYSPGNAAGLVASSDTPSSATLPWLDTWSDLTMTAGSGLLQPPPFELWEIKTALGTDEGSVITGISGSGQSLTAEYLEPLYVMSGTTGNTFSTYSFSGKTGDPISYITTAATSGVQCAIPFEYDYSAISYFGMPSGTGNDVAHYTMLPNRNCLTPATNKAAVIVQSVYQTEGSLAWGLDEAYDSTGLIFTMAGVNQYGGSGRHFTNDLRRPSIEITGGDFYTTGNLLITETPPVTTQSYWAAYDPGQAFARSRVILTESGWEAADVVDLEAQNAQCYLNGVLVESGALEDGGGYTVAGGAFLPNAASSPEEVKYTITGTTGELISYLNYTGSTQVTGLNLYSLYDLSFQRDNFVAFWNGIRDVPTRKGSLRFVQYDPGVCLLTGVEIYRKTDTELYNQEPQP